MVRDLNYEGEDPSLISKDRRILSQVVPLWRIGHSKAVALWYGNPSRKLKLVGVTGTNGKTTTATLLYELFRKMGYRCGLLSTVCNYINDEAIPTDHTTPRGISPATTLISIEQWKITGMPRSRFLTSCLLKPSHLSILMMKAVR